MIVDIITYSPQAHIEVCNIIRVFEASILENGLATDEAYGYFEIDTPEESMDLLLLLDNVEIHWEE